MTNTPTNGLPGQFGQSFRLYFRNKMGMFYGYLFPAIFLLAFRVLYRAETVPMARHMGQLLTVTILGGACLGMPTTMVSERERGVWRRYKLTPVPTQSLVASAVLVRFFILITAGLLQLALAMAIGMPFPKHPLELSLAFTFVAFAFLGLGLVIATIADNVPSVQALGQCIFLPMLIVGGVAVPLESLPNWAQHLAAFLPGKYAVQSLQACITGQAPSYFDLAALLLIGIAGFAAGAAMFRWDAQQKFASRGKKWLVAVLAAWVIVGSAAEFRRRPEPSAKVAATKTSAPAADAPANTQAEASPLAPEPAAKAGSGTQMARRSTRWQEVTVVEIMQNVDFTRLPPDTGIVSPIARPGVDPPDDMLDQLNNLAAALPDWAPGQVDDPVQHVRNVLYVAAVPDVLETEILESYVPLIVFDKLKQDIPKADLIRILFWVAVHPSGGDDSAAHQLEPLGLGRPPADMDQVRERVTYYSLKLLGRLLGKLPGR